jgi:hypothetical protein
MKMMNRFIPALLISLLATGAAAPMAFAGAARISVPEPSSLDLLAGGMGIVYLVHKLRRRK